MPNYPEDSYDGIILELFLAVVSHAFPSFSTWGRTYYEVVSDHQSLEMHGEKSKKPQILREGLAKMMELCIPNKIKANNFKKSLRKNLIREMKRFKAETNEAGNLEGNAKSDSYQASKAIVVPDNPGNEARNCKGPSDIRCGPCSKVSGNCSEGWER